MVKSVLYSLRVVFSCHACAYRHLLIVCKQGDSCIRRNDSSTEILTYNEYIIIKQFFSSDKSTNNLADTQTQYETESGLISKNYSGQAIGIDFITAYLLQSL